MDSFVAATVEFAEAQVRAMKLFARAEAAKLAGDYALASEVYADYVDAAAEYLDRALKFNQHFPDKAYDLKTIAQPLVNALMIRADIQASLGQNDAALKLRDQALALSRQYLGREGTIETRRALAGSLTLAGRFNEAISTLFEVRDMLLESADALALARVEIDLADVLHWLGDYHRAKDEVDHAYSMIEPLLDGKQIAITDVLTDTASAIASILAGRGNPGIAERTAQLYRAFVEITYYRGLLAKAIGQWDEAQRCFEKIRPEYRRLGVEQGIEFQIAQVELGRGRHSAALDRFRDMADTFEGGPFRPKRPVLQRSIAECLRATGRGAEATALLQEAIEDLQTRFHDPDALWRAQALQARIRSDSGQGQEALVAFGDAIDTVQRLRLVPLGYRLDSTFLADKIELYTDAIDAARQCGDAAACCRFMDALKSRTLSAVLGGSSSVPTDEAFATRFDQLSREVDALEFAAYRDPAAAQGKRKSDLLAERATLLERIRIADPRWRNLTEPPPFDLSAIQSVLARRSQAVISLYHAGSTITGVLISQNLCLAASLTVTDDLRARLAEYVSNLTKSCPVINMHDLSAEAGVEAAQLIPEELLAPALQCKSLIVVPHGLLHLLPWSTLIHAGRRLFEYVPVGVYPSVALLSLDEDTQTVSSVSLLGVSHYDGLTRLPDLPTVTDEVVDIGSLYRSAAKRVCGPFLDAEATTENYQRVVNGLNGRGNTLHLSCHGMIVPKEPMNSGLLLVDAKLDAAEIAAHRLPFDEAVLSACSTGWRPVQVDDVPLNADEILGIPGAFLEAGVRSVLVSITKAEGRSAAAFTTEYHRQRVAGKAPLPAFQAAQQRLYGDRVPTCQWSGFAMYSYM